MNLNFIHPTLLIFINGVYILFSARLATRKGNLKDQSLERIFAGIIISILWLIIGIYFKINILILVFEAMAIGLAYIGLVLKLNMPREHKIFGWIVPGHGMPESKRYKTIMKIFICLFFIAIVLLLLRLYNIGETIYSI